VEAQPAKIDRVIIRINVFIEFVLSYKHVIRNANQVTSIFKTHGSAKVVKVNGTDCSAPMFSNDDLCIILMVPFAGTIAPPALFAIYHFSVDEQYDVRIIFKLTSAPHVSPFGSFSFTFFPLSKSMQLGENDYRNTEFLCEGFQRT